MTSYLIIKLGAIGDVAMATTIASELRKSNPAVQITWVVGRAAKPLLEATNIVDEIITADEDAILCGSLSQKISAVWAVVSKLGMRKFDVCLIPYRDWRYHILRAGVRCKEVRTFSPDRWLIPGRYHGFEYARLALGRDLAPDENITLPPAQSAPYSGEKVPAILLAPGSPSPQPPTECANGRWIHMCSLRKCCATKGMRLGLWALTIRASWKRYSAPYPWFHSSTTLQFQNFCRYLGRRSC